MKIWLDLINTSHIHFFHPFIKNLRLKHEFIITCREFAETVKLAEQRGIDFHVIGRHHGKSRLMKFYGVLLRNFQLMNKLPNFDVAISHGSINSSQVAKFKRRKSISFDDNDISSLTNKLYARFTDYWITPDAIPISILRQQIVKEEKIYQYHGFKEDVYIADFIPNPSFPSILPFKDYVTVRPENLKAIYVSRKETSLVPTLVKTLCKENINILFLPRFNEEKKYTEGASNIYMPQKPLNGLDVCYYSNAVLTGAGTFAREAACIGTPAIQFFPGTPASVDKKLIEEGKMFNSRDVNEIVDYVLSAKKRKLDLRRSKKVQREVFDIVKGILDEIEMRKH